MSQCGNDTPAPGMGCLEHGWSSYQNRRRTRNEIDSHHWGLIDVSTMGYLSGPYTEPFLIDFRFLTPNMKVAYEALLKNVVTSVVQFSIKPVSRPAQRYGTNYAYACLSCWPLYSSLSWRSCRKLVRARLARSALWGRSLTLLLSQTGCHAQQRRALTDDIRLKFLDVEVMESHYLYQASHRQSLRGNTQRIQCSALLVTVFRLMYSPRAGAYSSEA